MSHPSNNAQRLLVLLVLGCVWVLTWALAHAYEGLRHDGLLYTLQALGHLRPQSLSHDVFLEFGSQDHYSVFSPIYAATMAWLGTEPAAAVLTLASQLALLLSAWILARRTLSSTTTALLGLTLVLAVPGAFGADRVFHYFETIVTPRMTAEALVLGSLAAASCARRTLALVLCALAVLLHPVIAAAGVVALLFLYVGIPRPRLTAAAAVLALIMLPAGAYLWPVGPFSRFDSQWLELVRLRSPDLFMSTWKFADWQCAAVVLITLLVGPGLLPAGRARTVALVALLTGLSGLVLNFIAVDCLDMVHLTQAQPWRWMWLATVIAALTLPEVAVVGWSRGSSGKATVTLLASAWIFGSDPLALYVAAGALASLAVAPRLPQNMARLILFGSYGVLILAVLARLAWNSVFLDAHYYDPSLPEWFRRAGSFVQDGSVPVAIGVLAVWLASRPRQAYSLAALAALGIAACGCVLPYTWSRWTTQQFPRALVEKFRPWRALIPPGENVFWPESPVAASLLLERPDYLSMAQTAGLVFSRPAAMELRRRAFALAAATAPLDFLDFNGNGIGLGPSPTQLRHACHSGEFEFLVTGARLDWSPVAEIPPTAWRSSGGLRLYRCSDRTS
jgi:hypothetical protein